MHWTSPPQRIATSGSGCTPEAGGQTNIEEEPDMDDAIETAWRGLLIATATLIKVGVAYAYFVAHADIHAGTMAGIGAICALIIYDASRANSTDAAPSKRGRG